MSVSNEDREAAIEKLRQTKCVSGDGVFYRASTSEASKIIAALVSHGWEPKPVVLAATLDNVLAGKWPGGTRVLRQDLHAYLRECGIEVTQ